MNREAGVYLLTTHEVLEMQNCYEINEQMYDLIILNDTILGNKYVICMVLGDM